MPPIDLGNQRTIQIENTDTHILIGHPLAGHTYIAFSNSNGRAYESDAVAAMQWVYDNKERAEYYDSPTKFL